MPELEGHERLASASMKIIFLLLGSFLAALVSGAAGFLSLDLSPVAYIASEAATAMHILKIIIYSKLTAVDTHALLIGLSMGACMFVGTYAAKHFIRRIEKGRFRKYVAVLLCVVGVYMLITGA